MDVNEINDQRPREPNFRERGDDATHVALVEGTPPVEAMGDEPGARVDCGQGLLVGGGGVSEGDEDTARGQQTDRVQRARRLRGGCPTEKRAFEMRTRDEGPDAVVRARRRGGDAFEGRREACEGCTYERRAP